MVVYNLDETPDVFISPDFYDNEFVYEMALIKGEDNRKTIRSIDLRKDKLMIHGIEIKEPMIKKLHESLLLRPKFCIIYVNCNGACYVYVGGKYYRPMHNVIFDWSSIGVIVPISVNELLKKRVEELEKAVENSNKEGELARIEVESVKSNLKASNDEVIEFKKAQNDLGLKLQKAYEKVALVDFELELYKIELESFKKELDEVLDDLCCCKNERAKMEVKIHEIRDQLLLEISTCNKRNCDLEMNLKVLRNELTSIQSELRSTKDQLELSNRNVKEVEDQLCVANQELSSTRSELHIMRDQLLLEISNSNKRNYDLEMRSKLLENELSSVRSELCLSKDQLKLSNKNEKASEEQLCVANQELSLIRFELQTTRDQLAYDISISNKRSYDLEMKSKLLENELSSTQSELSSTKDQLESSNKIVKELQEQLCMANKELSSIRSELHTTRERLLYNISISDKRAYDLEMKSKELENQVSLLQSEHSLRNQLEFSHKITKELEEQLSRFKNKCGDMKDELDQIQYQLCVANKEVQNTMTLLESSRKEVEKLNGRIKCYEEENQCMELQMQQMSNHINLINLEVKSNNQRLDQLLISSLWKKLNHGHHNVSIPCTSCEHTIGVIPHNLNIIAHDIQINQGDVD